ncbi:MAG: hypothetical protein ACRDD5_05310 [Silvania sp.]|jgi:hypothetical protein|uniref:Uncharacterized protein n=1 Tax=Silvania hatchlandensis TaxID=2926469 RepID=A0A9J6PVC5_9ENTR|nr:hypothetical protein [Silvania hatchlandensis]MCU6664295.1 hypothetical protein [Silvania hatchlandensis]
MHRTKPEKLKDDLIGEAVLLILKNNGPINFKALASKLRAMALSESDPERQTALAAAVAEIEQRTSGHASNHAEIRGNYSIDNMHHLMTKNSQQRADKKH